MRINGNLRTVNEYNQFLANVRSHDKRTNPIAHISDSSMQLNIRKQINALRTNIGNSNKIRQGSARESISTGTNLILLRSSG